MSDNRGVRVLVMGAESLVPVAFSVVFFWRISTFCDMNASLVVMP